MHDSLHRASEAALPLLQLTERMRTHEQVRPEQIAVGDVVAAVLDAMDGRLSTREAELLQEIAGLGRIIDQAKADVAEVNVDAIRGSHIPSATDELDAIVENTALATNDILESCELLDELAGLTPAQTAILHQATTKIYEACSFQDITGQRITKIVKALKAIEAKVIDLSGRLAPLLDIAAAGERRPEPGTLLNGPALPQEAMDQADIDKLLADF